MAIKGKKGSSVADGLYIFIFLFVVVFVAGLSVFIYGKFNDGWQDSAIINTEVKAQTNSYNTLFYTVMDGGIVFWFLILWIGSLLSSYFLDNSPIFLVLFFITSVLSFFALIPFANMQIELAETALNAGYTHLPMSMFIFNNLIIFAIGYFITVGGATFAKIRYAY